MNTKWHSARKGYIHARILYTGATILMAWVEALPVVSHTVIGSASNHTQEHDRSVAILVNLLVHTKQHSSTLNMRLGSMDFFSTRTTSPISLDKVQMSLRRAQTVSLQLQTSYSRQHLTTVVIN